MAGGNLIITGGNSIKEYGSFTVTGGNFYYIGGSLTITGNGTNCSYRKSNGENGRKTRSRRFEIHIQTK